MMADFRVLQQQWTAWIRQPESQVMPDGEARRLHIYRELFFNNVSSFVENAFPVVKKYLADTDWQSLVNDFFAQHYCQSPYFYDISHEFLQFLPTQARLLSLYPWLIEVAHFEWAELAAEMADAELPVAILGDFWQGVPVLSPFVWPLVYQWPVHLFAAREQSPHAESCCLVLYRQADETVAVMEVNPLTLHLVQLLQQNQILTGQEIITNMAQQLNLEADFLLTASEAIVSVLVQNQLLLGIKPNVSL